LLSKTLVLSRLRGSAEVSKMVNCLSIEAAMIMLPAAETAEKIFAEC